MTDHSPEPQLYFPALAGLYAKVSDCGYPLIRVALGLWMIPHGMQKLFGAFGGPGIDGAIGMMAKNGLQPAIVFAWLAILIEFFGGICIAIGFLTRPIAFLFFIEMIIAAVTVHLPNGWFVVGRGAEYALFLGVVALGVAMVGSGHCSLDRKIGKTF